MTGASWIALAAASALACALTQLHEVSDSTGLASGAITQGRPRHEQLLGIAARHAGARYLLIGLVTGCAVAAIASPWQALVAALLTISASIVRTRRRERGHRRACESGVPALARSLGDALRGGASIRSALAAAAEDRSIPAPLRLVVEGEAAGLTCGAPLHQTLSTLAETGGPALRLLCGTVAMHVDAGGALASQLDRLATEVDASRSVEQDRVAATAQARATVRVVAALPLLAMGGAQLASPGFLAQVVEHPVALALLLLGLVLEAAAVIAASAIVGPAR